MRTAIVFWIIFLLLAAPVAAHDPSEDALLPEGTYLHHTNLHEGTLEAGAWNNTTLAWAGTPLRGWWFLLWSGHVEGNGSLEATVLHDNETVRAWTWQPGQEELVVHRIMETGFHELRLHNPGPEPVTFRLYYDNTCDCTSKVAQRETSPLWFNYNLTRPSHVPLEVSIVPFMWPKGQDLPPVGDLRVDATVATWKGPGDAWPEDFDVATTFDVELPPAEDGSLWTLDMGFTAKEAGTNYILLTVHHDGDPRWLFQVRPVVELPQGEQAPGLGFVVVVGVVAVAGALARTKRDSD